MIAIAVTIGLLALAKRGRGKRAFGRYIKGNVDNDFSLGTLAASTALLSVNVDTVSERAWCSSLKATWTRSGWTVADNVGPIEVGVMHSDYTLAELEAFLELTSGWDEGDLISREVASRKIRRIGVFEAPGGGGLGADALNGGRPVHTKTGWMLKTGATLTYWAYNMGTGAVVTTDPNIHIRGHANLWPR